MPRSPNRSRGRRSNRIGVLPDPARPAALPPTACSADVVKHSPRAQEARDIRSAPLKRFRSGSFWPARESGPVLLDGWVSVGPAADSPQATARAGLPATGDGWPTLCSGGCIGRATVTLGVPVRPSAEPLKLSGTLGYRVPRFDGGCRSGVKRMPRIGKPRTLTPRNRSAAGGGASSLDCLTAMASAPALPRTHCASPWPP